MELSLTPSIFLGGLKYLPLVIMQSLFACPITRPDLNGFACGSCRVTTLFSVQYGCCTEVLKQRVQWTGFSGQAPPLTSEAGYRP